jgi:hypothetical protein
VIKRRKTVMENEMEKNPEIKEPEKENECPEPENETPAPENDAAKAAIAELKRALSGKDGEIDALNRALKEAKGESAELSKELAKTVAVYRELIVKANPSVMVEMVTGDSIKKINQSLQSARAIMDKARREIEADALRSKIPAGAPQRTPPDMSALSAREKIQYGLGGG